MRYRTQLKVNRLQGRYEAICAVDHPMRFGAGTTNHYIKTMAFRLNNEVIAEMLIGPQISANPFIGIDIVQGKPGDVVSVEWEDSHSNRGAARIVIDA